MHSFNFIALSAFIKTHLSQREREKKKRRARKVVVGDTDEDCRSGGGGVQTERKRCGDKDFPERANKRCFEVGVSVGVVLVFERGAGGMGCHHLGEKVL